MTERDLTAPVEDPSVTDYAGIVSSMADQRQARIKGVLETVSVQNPDQAAEAAKLSRDSGLDQQTAYNNLPEVRRLEALRQIDLARMAERSPILMRQLQDPNFASQAHDDVPVLQQVEEVIKALPGGAEAGWFTLLKGGAGGLRAVAETADSANKMLGVLSGVGTGPLAGVSDRLFSKPLLSAAQWLGDSARASGQRAEASIADIEGDTARGIISGVQSLASNAPLLPLLLLPGGQAAFLGMMATNVGGQSYQDAREKGLSPLESLAFGARQGSVEYITEKFPVEKLMGGLRAGSPLFKTLLKSMALEIPGEQAATLLQDLNEWATLNPEAPFSEYLAARPSAAYQTLIATLVGTAGQVSLAYGARKVLEKFSDGILAADLASKSAEELQNALKVAGDSKLRERNAEAFMAAAANMGRDESGAESVIYVDAERLAQVAPEIQEQMPSIASQLETLTGTVAIPVSEALAIAPGTPLEAVLVEHGRMGSPEALSKFEAETATTEAQAQLETEAAKVVAASEAQVPLLESRARVEESIRTQLQAAGRFSKSVNADYAKYVGAFYTAIGGRLKMTPEEAMARYPLKVVNQSSGPVLQQMPEDAHQAAYDLAEGDELPTQYAGDKKVAKLHKEYQRLRVASDESRGNGLQNKAYLKRMDRMDEIIGELEDHVVMAATRDVRDAESEDYEQALGDFTDITPPLSNEEVEILAQRARQTTKLSVTQRLLRTYLTSDELKRLTPRGERAIHDAMQSIDAAELAAMGYAGVAKRGWYKQSFEAIQSVFGEDAPRFTAVLAATSPQNSVQENLRYTVGIWARWVDRGRPQSPDVIKQIMADVISAGNVSVVEGMQAWTQNTARALTAKDPVAAGLSGPKVDSFFRNLLGFYNEVTNDTWMARAMGVEQTLFAGSKRVGEAVAGKGPGYLLANAKTREAAALLTKESGETWTPAEVQETVWSYVKALWEARGAPGELRSMVDMGAPSDEAINGVPDFSTLLTEGKYRRVLEEAGYGQQLEALAARSKPEAAGRNRKSYRKGTLARANRRLERQYRKDTVPTLYGIFRQRIGSDVGVSGDVSGSFRRRAGAAARRNLGGIGKAEYSLQKEDAIRFNALGISTPTIVELDAAAGAQAFAAAITKAKSTNTYGASVFVYSPEEYQQMRLFLTKDGTSGFAIKSDGDIVSVFNTGGGPNKAVARHLLLLALEEGGTKMDNFDTELTSLYKSMGFRVAKRETWNDEFKPDGWDYGVFSAWNNGRPDVVWMEYQSQAKEVAPDPIDDGSATLLFQSAAVGPAARPPFFSALIRALENAKLTKASPEQWLNTLKNLPGIKQEEMEYYDLAGWMKDQKSITREDLLDYLRANELQIEETVLGARGRAAMDLTAWDDVVGDLDGQLKEKGMTPLDDGQAAVLRYPNAETIPFLEDLRDRLGLDVDSAMVAVDQVIAGNPAYAEDDVSDEATKFHQYQTPGGENYREVLLKLPEKTKEVTETPGRWKGVRQAIHQEGQPWFRISNPTDFKSYEGPGTWDDIPYATKEEAEAALGVPTKKKIPDPDKNFTGGHFDEPNVIAHIRFNERYVPVGILHDEEGRQLESIPREKPGQLRVLFIEEIQSDLHQKGRKQGYKGAVVYEPVNKKSGHNGPAFTTRLQAEAYIADLPESVRADVVVNEKQLDGAVPDAPFKTTWSDLALKRMVRWAAENGFDSVAWTTGEMQADRYDLSKHLSSVRVHRADGGQFRVEGFSTGIDNARPVIDTVVSADKLADTIGKDLAEQIASDFSGDRSVKRYSGVDLKVGGEGMKGFYDKILPAAANKIGKKYGAKVGTTKLGPPEADIMNGEEAGTEADTLTVHSLPITPELREAALGGQPLFQTNRGTFSPSRLEISLTDNADLSTFLHETGHFFLEVLADVAAQPNQIPSFTNDMKTVLDWFGIADLPTWQGMTLEQKRPYHERFAESFEEYLLEGKAPTPELQPLFRRFKAFLLNAYKSLAGLQAGFTGPETIRLSDDVRRVFDRLLATEEEIAAAEDKAGMSPNEEATATAEERLSARSIADLKWSMNARARAIRRIQKSAGEIRSVILADVKTRVKAMPVYAVQEWIKGKGQPDGTPQVGAKIDTAALAEMYGDSPASPRRYLATNLVGAEGLHPDIIADMFEFKDGDTMIREIIAAPPLRAMVDALTDEQMLREHGDLVDRQAVEDAANEAVHNEARAKSLATELKSQSDALNVREDTGRKTSRGSRITVNALLEAAKRLTEDLVSTTKLKDLQRKPNEFLAAERRAAQSWQKNTMAAKTKEAVSDKRQQLISNVGYRVFTEANFEVKKILDYFAKVAKETNKKALSRGRDADVINAARVILAAHGIGEKGGIRAGEYLDILKTQDPEMFALVQPAVQAAILDGRPIEQMTVEEVRALHESLQSMMYLAKRSRQMEINGKLIPIEEAEKALAERMVEYGIPAEMPGDSGALTSAEEAKIKLRFAGAWLTRAEQWSEGMDGKHGGPFLKYVFQPINYATQRYTNSRVKYRKKLEALFKTIEPTMVRGRIEAPKLGRDGYVFGNKPNSVAMVELLHVLLHLGNDSNKRKLLLGRGWATEREDGTLDTGEFDGFIAKMHSEGVITKAHYDFVQGVHDLFEETKAHAQETHRNVFGHYFEEITAAAYDTPFGKYKGGYVPAMVDSSLVGDAARRKLMEAENETMAYAFPSTGRGFTKSRVEYNRPLILDLNILSQHLDKVLLFSNLEAAVKDVQRLLTRKDVSEALFRINPTALIGFLTPWLNRAARQVVETPVEGDGGLSRGLSMMRNRSGIAMMFGNLLNALQQVTGLPGASSKLYSDNLKSNIMRSMASYIASPVETTRSVMAASDYMKTRLENEVISINDSISDILLKPTVWQSMTNWTQRHSYFLQQAMDYTVSIIAWQGAYNSHLEQHGDDAAAVQYADGLIRQTQGSNRAIDVSRIETGNAFARLFTQFAGYFNMLANTNATALKQISKEMGLTSAAGAGKAVVVLTVGLLSTLWIAQAISVAMRGGPDDPDDDGYLDDWLWAVFGMGTFRGLTAMVPVVGQFANATVNAFTDNPYDDRMSLAPVVNLIESIPKALSGAYKAIEEDGSKGKVVKAVAQSLSLLTGLPLTLPARPISYAVDVEEGRIRPTGPVDLARGLVTGTPSPESVGR